MAKRSVIRRNDKRIKLSKRYEAKRLKLKSIIRDDSVDSEERYAAVLTLSALPRDSSKVRVRNRCLLTGRGRGFHRRFHVSRIKLRELAASGELVGVTKSSW